MEDRSPPPSDLKPWYYQTLFLVAALVLWPSWSFLILRSPWHNGILSGGLAWAFLVAGGVLGFRSVMESDGSFVIVFYVPGIALTLGTQIHWAGYKRQFIDPLYPSKPAQPEPAPPESTAGPPPARRPRRRRRSQAGRTPRQ